MLGSLNDCPLLSLSRYGFSRDFQVSISLEGIAYFAAKPYTIHEPVLESCLDTLIHRTSISVHNMVAYQTNKRKPYEAHNCCRKIQEEPRIPEIAVVHSKCCAIFKEIITPGCHNYGYSNAPPLVLHRANVPSSTKGEL